MDLKGECFPHNTWDRELRALNMSKKTKQVKVMVVSRGVISLSRNCNTKMRFTIRQETKQSPKTRLERCWRIKTWRLKSPDEPGSGHVTHLSPEDEERPTDDDEGRDQNLDDQAACEDAVSNVTRRFTNNITVHRFHPQTAPEQTENTLTITVYTSLILFKEPCGCLCWLTRIIEVQIW